MKMVFVDIDRDIIPTAPVAARLSRTSAAADVQRRNIESYRLEVYSGWDRCLSSRWSVLARRVLPADPPGVARINPRTA